MEPSTRATAGAGETCTIAVETGTENSCRRIAENRRKAELKKAYEIKNGNGDSF